MKPSIINKSNVHESMDTILQDVQRTILQTNEIERFAVFSHEKTIRPRPYHLSHLFLDNHMEQEAAAESIQMQMASPALADMPPALSYGGDLDVKAGAQTLQDALTEAAKTKNGLTYIVNSENELTQSYAQLKEDAERVLTGLRALGLEPGDPVFFQFSSNHAMVTAFWACVLGGFVPTLVSAAPTYREMNASVKKLHHAWNLLEHPLILTDDSLVDEVQGLALLWHTDKLRVAAVEPMLSLERDIEAYPASPDDSVFFILTSGSTGMPKCVEHSHRSVLANVKGTVAANGFTQKDVSLDWMPLDHIGGIVMFHLVNVYTGCEQVRARTDDFIAQPLRWLDWMDRYRATKTWAPNFAFAMINDYEKDISSGSWDLSAMTCMINGAEAVVPKTIHRFLHLLAPHGLKGDVIRPAFGMSEISSAVVFSFAIERGDESSGVLTFEETSLTEQLRPAEARETGTVSFTELGRPIPGITIRIVNHQHELLPEDHIGSVQIKGPTTMKGYYKNDEADQEVFQTDGWFHTGDLGFLHEGRLTLTGREKDMIIINGKNYHNYEIEVIAEEVPGVETSFVAACSARMEASASDELILFFTPKLYEPSYIMRASQNIKSQIATKMGLSASRVIPVQKHAFPKTSSGKIERAQLKKRWQEGEFDEIIKELDIRLENEHTLPDWSLQKKWIPAPLHEAETQTLGNTVIFADTLGLADQLRSLSSNEQTFITVEPGQAFTQLTHTHFIIHPNRPSDYEQLFETLRSYGVSVKQIIHLWNYTTQEDTLHAASAKEAQKTGSMSALYVTKAIAVYEEPVEITFVSAHAMNLPEDQTHDVEKATTAGLMTAVQHEWPFIKVRCLDFSLAESAAGRSHASSIMTELTHDTSHHIAAYREGVRYTPLLTPLHLEKEQRRKKPPFESSGLYVITGGLGGIGRLLSEHLLTSYQAHLVLVGRKAREALSVEQQDVLISLEKLAEKRGGTVLYEKVDITDAKAIEALISKQEAALGKRLHGVIHFAGIIQEELLRDMTSVSLHAMYEAKVYGTIALHEAASKRQNVLFLSSSSARTLKGGMTVGAYCAANEFVEQFAHYQRLTSTVKPYCFSFSMWDETGMSEGSMIKGMLKERGYLPIPKRAGIQTMLACLMTDTPLIYIGLDRSKQDIQEMIQGDIQTEQAVYVFFKTDQTTAIEERLYQSIYTCIQSRLSGECSVHLYPEEYWKETEDGMPDEVHFNELIKESGQGSEDRAPQTETEKLLARIWSELLDVSNISCGDHFFLLGGHSLKATQMLSTVRQKTGFDVPLAVLFEHTRLGELADWIDSYAKADEAIPIRKIEKGQELPMSYAQQRQWFLYQLQPDLALYNNTISFRMNGPLDVKVLQHSLQQMVQRHESLRTSFAMNGDEPVQIIHEHMTLPALEVVDVSELASQEEKEQKAAEWAKREAGTPFRLEQDALFRAKLIRLSETDHLLLMSIHHIVSDGWSIGIAARELSEWYTAMIEGREPDLSPLPIQYADYALWQKEYLTGETLQKQLSYWKEQFAVPVEELMLPYDYTRPAVQSYRGKTKKYRLSKPLSEQLAVLSKKTDSTLYMTLLSAFSTLLHRLSSQDEFVIGSVIAGRNRTEMEQLIGFFVNTLALRIDHSGNPAFTELLERVKETTMGAYAHQDVPFEMVVDELNIVREAGKQPLFQVMFVLQNLPLEASPMGEATSVLAIEDNDTAKFDLSLFVFEGAEGLQLKLEYDADLFSDDTMERLLRYYEQLLACICENPAQPIRQMNYLPEKEKQKLLYEWSGKTEQPAGPLLITERFEAQVKKTPHAIALESGEDQWTYQELQEKVNRLAAYLQQRGVKPHEPVGLLIDRSPEMIFGVLAIVKAGGAYVPIDPEYPDARIDYMLRDTGIQLLLTKNEWLKQVSISQTELICLDQGYEEFLSEGELQPAALKPDGLAYINYTSGSTGQPKGVLIPHQAVIRLVCETDYVTLDEHTRILQIASFSFDAFTYEIWGALLNGGRLILTDRNTILSMDMLADTLTSYKITTGFLTVPLFNRLTEEHPEALSGFNALLVGGDALSAAHIRKALPYLPEGLLNGYGPTENTTFSCVHHIRAVDEGQAAVPIGQPIAYSQAYVLDDQLQPVPQGVIGEIYVGGTGLALGYLGDEEKTSQSFIPHPFQEGARLYKTGDMGRWLQNGIIDCLGRIDHQVKIRGHRVECGEIEAAMLRFEDILECAVIPHQHESGHKRLIGYFVQKGSMTTQDIRHQLKEILPDYMVPSLLIELEELPLTANGKVDQKRLPPPEWRQEEVDKPADRALSEEERVLEKVWTQLLGTPSIGVHDNYFELGGDSIIVIQMVARLAQEGYVIQPRDVFEKQTISQLALTMKKSDAAAFYDQSPVTGAVRLLPIQSWFFEQSLTNQDYWNLSAYMEFKQSIQLKQLTQVLSKIVDHHDMLRAIYTKAADGSWIQTIRAPGITPCVTFFDLTGVSQEEALEQIRMETAACQGTLSLERGEVIKAVLFHTSDGMSELFIAAHHLVMDGISWRIIQEDLLNGLKQLAAGQEIALAKKTASYQQWAEALYEYAQTNQLQEQVPFWQNIISQEEEGSPFQTPALFNIEEHAEILSIQLTKDQTDILLRQASQAYRTEVNDLLLSGLTQAVGKPLLITLEGHGREDLFEQMDLSRTVGWFTSSYPIFIPFIQTDVERQIKDVKETLRAVPQKGIGYGLLQYMTASRLLKKAAPQMSFNYLGQLDQIDGETHLYIADERNGHVHDPKAERQHLIDVYGYVVNGQLQMNFMINRELLQYEEVRLLPERFKEKMEDILTHCVETKGGFTPSDFPMVQLTQKQIDDLPDNVVDVYPLSPMQQGMLFHALLDQASQAYFGQVHMTLEGLTDGAAYEKAWNLLMERHSILRTTFAWEGLKEPVQLIQSEGSIHLTQHDVRHLSETDQKEAIEQYLQTDRLKDFKLEDTDEPLIRIALFHRDENTCTFVFSFHHILIDGWSLFSFIEESFSLYRSLVDEREVDLPAVRPYKDFIEWLQKQDQEKALAFWKHYMSGVEEATPLPGDDGHASDEDAGVDQLSIKLTPEMQEKLEKMTGKQKVTMSTLIQTAWGLLLHLHSGSDDVVFGVTVSGRPADLPQVESMTGLFINTLPLRLPITPEWTISKLLAHTQDTVFQMREFEYTVLPDIQQLTHIPNGDSLFNSIVVFENYPIESIEPYGVRIVDIASHEETNYDLTLVAVPGDTLELRVTYRLNQYTEKQIQSLMQQLIHTLEAMTEQMETPLSSFTIVTNEEKERIITDWAKNAQVSVLYPDQEEVYSGVHDPSCETEIYVLSEEHQLMPIGFPGDIFIGAKDIKALCGELADWMETHKIPHPFKHQTGEYLYPTGDVGVWTEKNKIQILDWM
ncbi:amino acid adenylation domain-containing protein [Bacillus safensis]|uniref:non-ribosomal peptide synthetase n=1 Tax=Bacillus safensis TaxID=561879 RepID=UPI00227FBAC0|nr:non-ribosomal peptide synthetase [Bacillus safensis]MCY7732830.1 amino acid adenylation domain-containing protein [Bacillus safensis]MEC1115954.1 amino acid adenylation domain-containing protein [Bacillus safensis]